MALAALGVAVLAYTSHPLPMYLSAVAWGMGNGAAQPALTAYVVDRIPSEVRGTAMSTFTLGNDIGLGIGATALGLILQASNFTVMFLVAAAVGLVGLGVFFVGDRRGWGAGSSGTDGPVNPR
jgi:predicted MFS family arabinose efflux permease